MKIDPWRPAKGETLGSSEPGDVVELIVDTAVFAEGEDTMLQAGVPMLVGLFFSARCLNRTRTLVSLAEGTIFPVSQEALVRRCYGARVVWDLEKP